MDICEEHEPIVYMPKRGHACPLCDALQEIEALEGEISGLREEIEKLREGPTI